MIAQSRQNVMAVLPDQLRHDQLGVRVDVLENVHPHPLAGDEPVFFDRIVGMPAPDGDALASKRLDHPPFHIGLRRPAGLIGGKTQVAAGDEDRFIGSDGFRLFEWWHHSCCHKSTFSHH